MHEFTVLMSRSSEKQPHNINTNARGHETKAQGLEGMKEQSSRTTSTIRRQRMSGDGSKSEEPPSMTLTAGTDPGKIWSSKTKNPGLVQAPIAKSHSSKTMQLECMQGRVASKTKCLSLRLHMRLTSKTTAVYSSHRRKV